MHATSAKGVDRIFGWEGSPQLFASQGNPKLQLSLVILKAFTDHVALPHQPIPACALGPSSPK